MLLPADPPVVIDVDDIQELVATAMSTGDYTPLIRRVGQIFSKHENLVVSFVTVRYIVQLSACIAPH